MGQSACQTVASISDAISRGDGDALAISRHGSRPAARQRFRLCVGQPLRAATSQA
jgi:hypothetical protein